MTDSNQYNMQHVDENDVREVYQKFQDTRVDDQYDSEVLRDIIVDEMMIYDTSSFSNNETEYETIVEVHYSNELANVDDDKTVITSSTTIDTIPPSVSCHLFHHNSPQNLVHHTYLESMSQLTITNSHQYQNTLFVGKVCDSNITSNTAAELYHASFKTHDHDYNTNIRYPKQGQNFTETEIHDSIEYWYTKDTLPPCAVILKQKKGYPKNCQHATHEYRKHIRGFRRNIAEENLNTEIFFPLLQHYKDNPEKYGSHIPGHPDEIPFVKPHPGDENKFILCGKERNKDVILDVKDNGGRCKPMEKLTKLVQSKYDTLNDMKANILPSMLCDFEVRERIFLSILKSVECFIQSNVPDNDKVIKNFIRFVELEWKELFPTSSSITNTTNPDTNDDDDNNNDDINKSKKKRSLGRPKDSKSDECNPPPPTQTNGQSDSNTGNGKANTTSYCNLASIPIDTSSNDSDNEVESYSSYESDWSHCTDDEYSSSDDDDDNNDHDAIYEHMKHESTLEVTPITLVNLPVEVLCEHILQFIGSNQFRFVGMINQSFHTIYTLTFPEKATKYNVATIECAKICFDDVGVPRQPILCKVAALHGNLKVLQYLRSINCQWDDQTTAMAAKIGNMNILQWSRDNGCPWGDSTCANAAKFGHLDILQWAHENECPWNTTTILANDENPNEKGWTILHYATYKGFLDIIRYIIKTNQIAVDAKDSNGRTALHYACKSGQLDLIECLVKEGQSNVNSTHNKGCCALHVAVLYDHLNIVQYLIKECHANIEASTSDGYLALHIASREGHMDIIQYLIKECHVDVETTTNAGWTALLVASDKGHMNIVQYLIKVCNANAEATSNDGWTALRLASEKGHLEIVQYLTLECNANADATAID